MYINVVVVFTLAHNLTLQCGACGDFYETVEYDTFSIKISGTVLKKKTIIIIMKNKIWLWWFVESYVMGKVDYTATCEKKRAGKTKNGNDGIIFRGRMWAWMWA